MWKIVFLTLIAQHKLFIQSVHSYNDQDDKNYNLYMSLCQMNDTCEMHQDASQKVHIQVLRCRCDEQCGLYGDCCPDSQYYPNSDPSVYYDYDCFVDGKLRSTYLKKKCPPSWKNSKIRSLCERPINYSQPSTDTMSRTPVFSKTTGINYKNVFCGICSGDRHFEYWEQSIVFSYRLPWASTIEYVKNLTYDNATGDCSIWLEGYKYGCNFYPEMPKHIEAKSRYCIPDVISTCTSNVSSSPDLREACRNHTSVVYYGRTPAKNRYCAICNDFEHFGGCQITPYSGDTRPLSVLFDVGQNSVAEKHYCDRSNHEEAIDNDPSLDLIRAYLCAEQSQPRLGKVEESWCLMDTIPKSDFTFVAEDVIYVEKFKKNFTHGQYEVIDTEELVNLCLEDRNPKYSPLSGAITTLGIGVSLVFLLLHLTVFVFVKELHNLSGKNMASFSLALFSAYTNFLVGNFLEETSFCFVTAVFTYYYFMASFLWMFVMSFDVWFTIWRSTKKLRSSRGRQTKKFFRYSVFCWLGSAAFVGISLSFEELTSGTNLESFKPNFGVASCWFGNAKALLTFFVLPCFLVIASNLIFYCSTVHTLFSNRTNATKSVEKSSKDDFKLCSRLALLMGLTWTTAFLAGFFEIQILWMMFILLNSLQGLFIFVAFSCTKRVLKSLTKTIDKSTASTTQMSTLSSTDTGKK